MEVICPLLITGFACANSPFSKVITGCLLKLTISEAPYPTPFWVRSTEVTTPLTTGWSTAWKSCPPALVETPIDPSTVATMGW